MIQYIVWFWNRIVLMVYPIRLGDISDLLMDCEESINELKELQKDNFIESNILLLKNITDIDLSENFNPKEVLKIIDKEIDYMNKKIEILGLNYDDVIINTNLTTLKNNFTQICYILELRQTLEWQFVKPKNELGSEYVFKKLGKSLAAMNDIKEGQKLTLDNIRGKIFFEPGIPVRETALYLNKPIKRDIKAICNWF